MLNGNNNSSSNDNIKYCMNCPYYINENGESSWCNKIGTEVYAMALDNVDCGEIDAVKISNECEYCEEDMKNNLFDDNINSSNNNIKTKHRMRIKNEREYKKRLKKEYHMRHFYSSTYIQQMKDHDGNIVAYKEVSRDYGTKWAKRYLNKYIRRSNKLKCCDNDYYNDDYNNDNDSNCYSVCYNKKGCMYKRHNFFDLKYWLF